MSKYIRTENEIIDLEQWGELFNEKELKNYKQANTIEELCDKFIVEYKNVDPTVFNDFHDLQRHYELYWQDYHHVAGRYGAIWVKGKGLIYIAKMNNKNELELL